MQWACQVHVIGLSLGAGCGKWMVAARLRRAIARSNRKYCVLGDKSRCHEVTTIKALIFIIIIIQQQFKPVVAGHDGQYDCHAFTFWGSGTTVTGITNTNVKSPPVFTNDS